MTDDRPRNPLWDAVCAAFGLRPETSKECRYVGMLVRDLKKKGAKPEDIARKKAIYRETWPTLSCTPTGVLRYWDQLETGLLKPVSAEENDIPERYADARISYYALHGRWPDAD